MNPSFKLYGTAALCLAGGISFLSAFAQTTQPIRPSREMMAKAYEESCVANLRTINVSQAAYSGGNPAKGYARTLKELGPSRVDYLGPDLAGGKKDGYRFKLIPERTAADHPIEHYTISARPVKRLVKDQRSFFTDETGVIRFTTEKRAATKADPPLGSK